MRKTSVSRKIFVVFNTIFLCTLALLCFLPLLNLFAISLSGKAAANSGRVTFWPSRDFKGRTAIMWFFVFTMLFGGGLIPSYLVNSSLGLKNSFWVYILPGAFSCYNMILIMNFFRTIPKALEEAARIDGASFFTVFRKIYLPLSKAGLATVGLFIMVGNWNEWFTGILYMSDTKNYPLASFLQVIVVQGNQQDLSMDPTSAAAMSERTIKAAQVFIGALPILLVYPFLQKYFVKGVVMGAVKE